MIAASRQLDPFQPDATAVGVYMSLRHAPLLKMTGEAYGRLLCEIIIRHVEHVLQRAPLRSTLRQMLAPSNRRFPNWQPRWGNGLCYFDDAAHLGREASLEEFFDIYRTLSSSLVSCKAAIYPGVTRFGVRFRRVQRCNCDRSPSQRRVARLWRHVPRSDDRALPGRVRGRALACGKLTKVGCRSLLGDKAGLAT